MKSNLDVKAIQYNPEDLYIALNKIDKGMNYVYSNCAFDFKIGKRKIRNRKFDTFLYNEESDTLIMLMSGGLVNKDHIINFLENNNKPIVEINFRTKYDDYKVDDNLPEILFSRDKSILEDAIKDSVRKGIQSCEFYPLLSSYFMMGFRNVHGNIEEVDGRVFKGLLKFNDKLVLLVNQKYNIDEFGNYRNTNVKTVLLMLKKYNIKTNVIIDKEPNLYVESFSKKLKRTY